MPVPSAAVAPLFVAREPVPVSPRLGPCVGPPPADSRRSDLCRLEPTPSRFDPARTPALAQRRRRSPQANPFHPANPRDPGSIRAARHGRSVRDRRLGLARKRTRRDPGAIRAEPGARPTPSEAEDEPAPPGEAVPSSSLSRAHSWRLAPSAEPGGKRRCAARPESRLQRRRAAESTGRLKVRQGVELAAASGPDLSARWSWRRPGQTAVALRERARSGTTSDEHTRPVRSGRAGVRLDRFSGWGRLIDGTPASTRRRPRSQPDRRRVIRPAGPVPFPADLFAVPGETGSA